jgi:hypothetical protein
VTRIEDADGPLYPAAFFDADKTAASGMANMI